MLRSQRAGFSMIEILVVVFIIGLLATLVGPRIVGMLGKANVNATKATMSTIKTALFEYKMDIGHFPTKSEGGLNALVQAPSKAELASKWKGPYIAGVTEVPQDKWGFDFIYSCPPERFKGKYKYYEIISLGADGQEGGDGEDSDIDMGE